jgi:hypothetical protein
VDEELEKRFKEAVFKDKGMKRGNISLSIEEALDIWIREKSKEQKEKK